MLRPIFQREIEEYPGKPEKRKSSVLDAWNFDQAGKRQIAFI